LAAGLPQGELTDPLAGFRGGAFSRRGMGRKKGDVGKGGKERRKGNKWRGKRGEGFAP